MNLINQILDKVEIKEPETDEHGFKFYRDLPAGFRTATIGDIKNSRKGMPYLVHSWEYDIYECARRKCDLDRLLAWIVPFVEAGRVYVLED